MSNKQNEIFEEGYWEFRNALEARDIKALENFQEIEAIKYQNQKREEDENLPDNNNIISDYMIK